MSLWDAVIRRTGGVADPEPPLLEQLRPGMTVGELARERASDPRDPWSDRSDEVVLELLRLEAAGVVRLDLGVPGERLHGPLELLDRLDGLLDADPALHNLVAQEREWRSCPGWYDVVDADTELGRLKAFERDLYLEHLDPVLEALPSGARILDAGCGAGRLAAELARRGFQLTLVDSAPTALKCAVRHALESGASVGALEAYVADVRDLESLPSDHVDATLAMEVLCYHPEPGVALGELTRVTRPGGPVIIAVEGRYGGLLGDPRIGLSQAEALLDGGPAQVTQDLYVEHQTPDSLRVLAESAGLECQAVHGTHYVADGPLARLASWEAAEPAVRERLLALERRCARDPVLRPLARSWLALCRKARG